MGQVKAPEKIYIHPDIGGREFIRPWLEKRASQESVEYIRTDAFIEKADEFISSFFHPDDTKLKNILLKKFHEYMEGE
jgi:hypothetical protein